MDSGGGTLNSGGFTLTGAIGQPEAGLALSSGSFTLTSGAFAGGDVAPEIDVQFYGQSFPNGYNYIDFDSVVIGGQVTHTFTISNTGNADLNLTGTPPITLTTGAHFTVTVQPASSVISNTAAAFQITFTPSAAGNFTDTVNIANNDANENPFTFVIAGTGTAFYTYLPLIVMPESFAPVTGNEVAIPSRPVVSIGEVFYNDNGSDRGWDTVWRRVLSLFQCYGSVAVCGR